MDDTFCCKSNRRGTQSKVPEEVAGVAFLSGGQSDFDATSHLNETNLTMENAPWPLTFSFGRALLADALTLWSVRN